MTFRKDCEELFGTSNLYEIFNVANKATNAEGNLHFGVIYRIRTN